MQTEPTAMNDLGAFSTPNHVLHPSPSKTNAPAREPFVGVDLEGFHREIRDLRKELEEGLCEADLEHLYKIERWGKIATAVGMATAWMGPNVISALGLGLGRSTRWILMHHVGHRGYDKVPGAPARYTSKVFARGRRRYLDWPDWMIPEAWIYEHNILHHSHTGEVQDPDLVERNSVPLRDPRVPKAARYGFVALMAASWKAYYYAPNTLREFTHRGKPMKADGTDYPVPKLELLAKCYLPYAAMQFVGLPLLFSPLGPLAVASAFTNSVLAEIVTNAHTFAVVGPNHAGDDLYRFTDKPKTRAEHLARQVVGTVNFPTGGDLNDYAHLWLNYQVEHHLFPDMPMTKYQEAQPKVKAICEKYKIPYIQENVFSRVKKLVDIMVGNTQMKSV
jgi:fatty acid desaturase